MNENEVIQISSNLIIYVEAGVILALSGYIVKQHADRIKEKNEDKDLLLENSKEITKVATMVIGAVDNNTKALDKFQDSLNAVIVKYR